MPTTQITSRLSAALPIRSAVPRGLAPGSTLFQLTGAATLAIGALLCGAGTSQAATLNPPTADGSRWALSHNGGSVAPAWSNQAAWRDQANEFTQAQRFAAGTLTAPSIGIGSATYGFCLDGTAVVMTISGVPRVRFAGTLNSQDNYGNYTTLAIRRSNGTFEAPTKILSGDQLGLFMFRGAYDNGGIGTFDSGGGPQIRAFASEDYNTVSNRGSYLSLYAIPNGSGSNTECLRVDGTNVIAAKPILAASGTAALPSIAFSSSPTDGFFRSAGSVIGGSIAGIERFRLQSDRLIINANAAAWYSPGISNIGLNGVSFYGADGVAIGFGGSSIANDVRFIARRANGTALVPTAVAAGDDLFNLQASGYDGTAFTADRARLTAEAAETWSATSHGTLWRFYATPIGATALAMAMEIGGASITAYQPILAAAGSVSSPSLSFSSDPNTGIYSNGADILSFATGGVERFRLSATGRSAFGSGNAAAPGIGFLSDGSTGMRLVATGSLALVTGGVDALSISAAQLVSIPSTADGALTVAGRITAKAAVPATFADFAAVRSFLASILT